MKMLDGSKYIYLVINGIMVQDPDDLLWMEDHALDNEIKCITNAVTNRSIQLKPGIFTLDVDYFNDVERRALIKTVASDKQVEPMVIAIMDYLNGKYDSL